nr:MAG TPA: Rsp5, Ubiquitin variant R5.4 E3, Rsp5, Ubiquitin, Ubv.31A [Caudoviricetes sp.]
MLTFNWHFFAIFIFNHNQTTIRITFPFSRNSR